MNVNLVQLGNIFQIIIDRAIELGIEEIDVKTDYYWSVALGDLENFQIENPQINVGSFVDDYENLKELISNKREPSIVDFNRIANVVRILGEKVSNSSKIY